MAGGRQPGWPPGRLGGRIPASAGDGATRGAGGKATKADGVRWAATCGSATGGGRIGRIGSAAVTARGLWDGSGGGAWVGKAEDTLEGATPELGGSELPPDG